MIIDELFVVEKQLFQSCYFKTKKSEYDE